MEGSSEGYRALLNLMLLSLHLRRAGHETDQVIPILAEALLPDVIEHRKAREGAHQFAHWVLALWVRTRQSINEASSRYRTGRA